MRIHGFEAGENEAGTAVSATLEWEDNERPDDTLYFASRRIRPHELVERPEPFVLAAFPLALWLGERRVRTEGVLCPRLLEGVALAAQQLIDWHPHLRPIELEAAGGSGPAEPPSPRHAAMLLSGGIDSMALLRRNHLDYPRDHPGRIRTAFLTFGLNSFDFDGDAAVPERRAATTRYGERLGDFARAQGVDLVPVETNVRALYPDFATWRAVGWALGTAAAGMSAAAEISDLWIANDGLGFQTDFISQVTLAPWVSPAALDFRVGGRVATRLEETRLVAEWDEAGPVVTSCFWHEIPEEPRINCGACEKCVRTMLALVAIGLPQAVSSFPADSLTPAHVERIGDAVDWNTVRYYRPLPPLLRQVGQDDLAVVVEALIQRASADSVSRPGFLRRIFGPA